jgi:hypothetical protein
LEVMFGLSGGLAMVRALAVSRGLHLGCIPDSVAVEAS